MSKIESHFTVDDEALFKFSLTLNSQSVEAHSLISGGYGKEELKLRIDRLANNSGLKEYLKDEIQKWKEVHK